MIKIYTLKEIDDLIFTYKKTKSPEIMEILINAFEGFIVKYAQFLKHGKLNSNNKDLIGLTKLLQKNNSQDVSKLIKKILESWDYYDVVNELKFIFIKSVNKFTKRKKGPYFAGYLYTYYKYMIKQWIQKISKDVMNLSKIENIDKLNFKDQVYINDNTTKTEYENFCLTGKTKLTQYEKYILYLHYGKKIPVSKIAKMYGMDRTSINLIKKKAKDKLINSGITLDEFEKI